MTRKTGIRLAIGLFATVFFVHALPLGPAQARSAKRRVQKAAAVNGNQASDNQPSYVASVLMEPRTGQILFEQEMHKPWPPASLTKMMLMLIVMEKVKQGTIRLTDPVEVSPRASKMGGSQVYLKQGEMFPLEVMMKAIVIHSANDASEAVAERIAGDSAAFVDMMNRRANELGLKNTKYYNVHGLPPERGQPSDMTSAYDTALLARELIKYPEILKWASTAKEDFRDGKFVLQNTNHLIGKFQGADGIKTGSYHEAGFNLAATAERDGLRLISVTLGSSTNKIRFREASRLLTMGFNDYKMFTVLKAGESVTQDIRIRGGMISALRAVAGVPAEILIKRAEEKQVKSSIQMNSPVWAPLKKGDKLGEITITLGDKALGKFILISDKDIDQSNVFKRLWDRFF
jgi:D-alanyl-D-alanine carboxypeptidase (penicillin-binding protein 5/6)